MRTSWIAVALLLVPSLVAGEPAAPADALTPDEQEFVALSTDYDEALDSYWKSFDQYDTPEAYKEALADGEIVDPNAVYVSRLLEFEAEHRGADVGLLALRRVFSEAARGGPDDGPTAVGRREAVGRFAAYTESRYLPNVVRIALLGPFEPAAYTAAVGIVESSETPKSSRDQVRRLIAAKDLQLQGFSRAGITEQIAEIENGAEPRARELEWLKKMLAKIPSADEMDRRVEAALATLEELAADPDSPRLPVMKGVDERWRVFRLVDDPESPTLAEAAAALLFKELRLKTGRVAPDLEVTLLDGSPWRMVDQRGKVVVVQFSFTGCGPCARMYPDMADLAEEHGDRLAVLTLMRDPTPDDALQGVADGKLTWSVAIDGAPGRVCRRWSVDAFPTTYVIGPDGVIADNNVRGDNLRNAVVDLLPPR